MAYKNGKMEGPSRGYVPPKGPGGSHGKGEYSMSKNPKPCPMKGSQIKAQPPMANADRSKVDMMKNAQMSNESLRGM